MPSAIYQTVSPRTSVNKPPADVPDPSGWHLSNEDLYAREDVLETGQEDGNATFEDL